MSVDQIRQTFEAGFMAALMTGVMPPEDEARRRMQHAWKKFCGVDT